ncbi:MAG: hypothetical protein SFV53_04270 [Rickettsiales bacterium]|nr:hypothetical protein [Rickettsiales bacterium]
MKFFLIIFFTSLLVLLLVFLLNITTYNGNNGNATIKIKNPSNKIIPNEKKL